MALLLMLNTRRLHMPLVSHAVYIRLDYCLFWHVGKIYALFFFICVIERPNIISTNTYLP
jgi:hypothetical protein